MSLINCGINLNLTWSEGCVTSSETGEAKVAVPDKKLYVSVATLSDLRKNKTIETTRRSFCKKN